jgi:hypothetical protein
VRSSTSGTVVGRSRARSSTSTPMITPCQTRIGLRAGDRLK